MLDRVRTWLFPPEAVSDEDENEDRLEGLDARLKTVARAQSKLSLRLDEIVDLMGHNQREVLAKLDPGDYGDLLDALDRLDDARRVLAGQNPELVEGLGAIALRIERYLARFGISRVAETGVFPDGQRVRVVATESRPDLPEGVVTRVVRSVATRGGEVLREGEVVVNRRAW